MPKTAPVLESAQPHCETYLEHPEAVAIARDAMPNEHDALTASLLLKAVADPTRLRILSALAATELCVCDLAALTGISESAVSHQMRLLRDRHLVAWDKRGREVYYRLADGHVLQLLSSAMEHAAER
jgi:ArsR family transcriptional regulator, lead/cadmium/zinc/bismuth-responsive transcriptional repressor